MAQRSGSIIKFLSLARMGDLAVLKMELESLDEDGRRKRLTATDSQGDTALLLGKQLMGASPARPLRLPPLALSACSSARPSRRPPAPLLVRQER